MKTPQRQKGFKVLNLSIGELDRHICLIGMPGAGKSWVGKELAHQMGVSWVDLDQEIESHQKKSISDIFDKHGEDYFRMIETEFLEGFLASRAPSVISLGGGTVLSDSNRRMLQESAWAVYLRASNGTLYEWLKDDESRPLLRGDLRLRIEQLTRERDPIYYKLADIVIDIDSIDDVEASKQVITMLWSLVRV